MIKNKYHGPIQKNLNYIESLIKDGAKVLEIGPGHLPFSKATYFCGWTMEEKGRLPNYKTADASTEKLPYKDKEFDFVYCRHVIEDLWNPVNALKEISRITKAGYIETPSALCEMSKDVDGGTNVPYRGYNHHRYIVWNDRGTLNILPKFPIIEYIKFEEEKLQQLLEDPFNWCTFYHFEKDIKYKLYEMGHEQDFVMFNNSYPLIIKKAMNESIEEAQNYKRKIS
jgi:ubiquinone/menaquinone biosynthesis C-methylase UbiE